MTVFRRMSTSSSGPSESVNRFGRLAGRVLLWGCVLLLLVRGIASYVDTTPQTASSTAATVTQQTTGTGTSQAEGR